MLDARGLTVAVLGEATFGGRQRVTGVPTDVAGERAEAGEDGDDARQRIGLVVDRELDVVDLAHEPTVAIHELAVEELEHGPHLAAGADGFGAHEPALVTIMRGMVASATMVSTTM